MTKKAKAVITIVPTTHPRMLQKQAVDNGKEVSHCHDTNGKAQRAVLPLWMQTSTRTQLASYIARSAWMDMEISAGGFPAPGACHNPWSQDGHGGQQGVGAGGAGGGGDGVVVKVVKVVEMGWCTRCRSLDQSTHPVGPQRTCPRLSCKTVCPRGTETITLRAGYCRHRSG